MILGQVIESHEIIFCSIVTYILELCVSEGKDSKDFSKTTWINVFRLYLDQLAIVFHISSFILDVSHRKAMKAVGVLFGFLGFSNFIFFINPKDGGYWEDAYYIINAIMQSSQVYSFNLFFELDITVISRA